MTALGKPEFLQHLSLIIKETRSQFALFNAGSVAPGSDASKRTLSLDAFIQQAAKLNLGLPPAEVRRWACAPVACRLTSALRRAA